MVWKYEKFFGDAAIYAFCPKCKFYHNPSELIADEDGKLTTEIQYQYNYCPICGEYLYDDKSEVDVAWNERDIEELYNIKIEF
jgi:hypothetical protein